MSYFMIHNNDDGDFYFREIDPEQFMRDLASGEYGFQPELINFLSYSPHIKEQMMEWKGNSYLIIKGEIVFPRPKKTVVEFQF